MVSVATGVASAVLEKISTLMEKEYSKLKGVRDEIISLGIVPPVADWKKENANL